MSTEATELTTEILERFRAALRIAGAPLGDAIEPGLSDAEIDAVEVQLGVAVPPELRTLWKWGRPSETRADPQNGGWDINPEFELWPPANAVAMTQTFRSLIPEVSRQIAFAGPPQDSCLMVDGDQTGATSSVRYVMIEEPDSFSAAPSLGALFQLWTDQLAGGDYKFSGDEWESLDGPLVFIPED